MIETIPVLDTYVEQALSLDDGLLEAGKEKAAIYEVVKHALSVDSIDVPQVWFLSPTQMTEFKEDFAAPTISHYKQHAEHSLSRYAVLQLALSASLGQPFGLPDQRDGVVVQDIFPRDDLIDRANSSFGATKDFAYHTDQAYNPNEQEVPDYIVLSSVRNDEQAPTTVANLSDALALLSREAVRQLCQPDFQFFKGRPEDAKGVRLGAVLTEQDQGFSLRLGTDVLGISREASQALIEFRESIEKVSENVVLKPGQSLVSPNKTTPHARRAFEPALDPQKRRWLQRVFVKSLDRVVPSGYKVHRLDLSNSKYL